MRNTMRQDPSGRCAARRTWEREAQERPAEHGRLSGLDRLFPAERDGPDPCSAPPSVRDAPEHARAGGDRARIARSPTIPPVPRRLGRSSPPSHRSLPLETERGSPKVGRVEPAAGAVQGLDGEGAAGPAGPGVADGVGGQLVGGRQHIVQERAALRQAGHETAGGAGPASGRRGAPGASTAAGPYRR